MNLHVIQVHTGKNRYPVIDIDILFDDIRKSNSNFGDNYPLITELFFPVRKEDYSAAADPVMLLNEVNQLDLTLKNEKIPFGLLDLNEKEASFFVEEQMEYSEWMNDARYGIKTVDQEGQSIGHFWLGEAEYRILGDKESLYIIPEENGFVLQVENWRDLDCYRCHEVKFERNLVKAGSMELSGKLGFMSFGNWNSAIFRGRDTFWMKHAIIDLHQVWKPEIEGLIRICEDSIKNHGDLIFEYEYDDGSPY